MVLPGMGLAKSEHTKEFMKQWYEYATVYDHPRDHATMKVPTSFAEDPFVVRLQHDLRDVPCYIGASTFHIKSNGDLYPCCLVGGEAIGTRKEYKLGNVWGTSLEELWHQHSIPKYNYAVDIDFCRNNCFWKQLALNVETDKASKYCLSMP
jgi:radical SAM protein with 4Fe4S-binding SPASM domain